MAEPRRELDVARLEAALRQIGRELDVPPTPQIAASVRRRIEESARPMDGRVQLGEARRAIPLWPTWPRALAIAAALVALLFGALLAGSPAARSAVADRLGLRGVEIVHLPTGTPPAPRRPVIATPHGPVGIRPEQRPVTATAHGPADVRRDLGERVSLAEARARASFSVVQPTLPELGEPDEVYVRPTPAETMVSFVYAPRAGIPAAAETGVGLLLSQFRGSLEPGFLMKGLGPGSRIEETRVDGGRAVWIEGEAHLFYYRDPLGEVRDERVRLAGNVLLWERGDLTLRLEGAISKEQALRIAASVRVP